MAVTYGQILENLSTSIEQVKAMEGCRTEIDTMKEKNELAKILKGAEREIGDLYNSQMKRTNPNVDTRIKYNEAIEQLNDFKQVLTSSLNQWETFDGQNVKYKDGVKHFNKNNKLFDYKLKDLDNGAYVARVYDGNYINSADPAGEFKGLRVYKNDHSIYTNREYVAKKLGLKKQAFENMAILPLVAVTDLLVKQKLGNRYVLSDDEYYDKYGSIYRWDDANKMFITENEQYECAII